VEKPTRIVLMSFGPFEKAIAALGVSVQFAAILLFLEVMTPEDFLGWSIGSWGVAYLWWFLGTEEKEEE